MYTLTYFLIKFVLLIYLNKSIVNCIYKLSVILRIKFINSYNELYINNRFYYVRKECRKIKLIGARGQPLFPFPFWNQYHRVLTRNDMTNYIAEAAHRALYSVLNGSHSNIWSFVDIGNHPKFSRFGCLTPFGRDTTRS